MHVEYVPCIWEAAEETGLEMGCTEADALEVGASYLSLLSI